MFFSFIIVRGAVSSPDGMDDGTLFLVREADVTATEDVSLDLLNSQELNQKELKRLNSVEYFKVSLSCNVTIEEIIGDLFFCLNDSESFSSLFTEHLRCLASRKNVVVREAHALILRIPIISLLDPLDNL